jgi:diguanylate cyclase
MRTFRNRLLILLIGLVVGAQTVTLFTALARTSTTERQRADDQLTAGAQVARELIQFRERQLASAVAVLAADFGLREAIATSDRETVASALGNHASRIGADLTLAIDLDGHIVATGEGSPSLDASSTKALLQGNYDGQSAPRFIVASGVVYQIFIAPVRAPEEIAVVALGFALDQRLAEQIKGLIHVDVVFLAQAAKHSSVLAGTLQSAGQSTSGVTNLSDVVNPTNVTIGNTDYLATSVQLSSTAPQPHIALLKPMEEVRAPYVQLSRTLGAIVGVTLVAAMVAGVMLGRSASNPILKLAVSARRIAKGDYSTSVEANGPDEIVELAHAINAMQGGIAEREARLLHGAYHDEVTGLPNRAHAHQWLEDSIAQPEAEKNVTVVLLNVTNLQELSAALGHEMAQRVVVHIASGLKRWRTPDSFVARLDGARFAVLARGKAIDAAPALARELREVVMQPIHTSGVTLRPTAIAGIAFAPLHGTNAMEVFRCAEAAAEAAAGTRGRIGYFERSSDEVQRRRLRIGADLPLAIAAGDLHVNYQAKVSVSDRRAVSAEVLARWRHPELGDISPLEFVEVAEHTGASSALTRWVLNEALAQLSAWREDGLNVELAVNLSATDIADPELLEFILEALRNQRLSPGSLTLEITESAFMRDADQAIRNMEMLCVAGVRFSVDDFGTGYSSLSQLRQLSVDELKIDRSFIGNIVNNAEEAALVKSIIELGHGLGLRVVAEGLETEDQWRMLVKMGCDYAQGYLISKPVPAIDFANFARRTLADRGDASTVTAILKTISLRRNG